jgi:hypothetical protein
VEAFQCGDVLYRCAGMRTPPPSYGEKLRSVHDAVVIGREPADGGEISALMHSSLD